MLFILNGPPYRMERPYNALRPAHPLLKKDPQTELTVFLMADAVVAAEARQKTPDGSYNTERMLKRISVGNGKVLLCGTCTDVVARMMQLSSALRAAAQWRTGRCQYRG